MRIRRIKIDGFGHFRHFDLPLAPGLNLLHGRNEAGKSTLLAFVRSMLFGFERRNDPARYEPQTGPYGGELWLDTHFGQLVVRRIGSRRRYDGELIVRGVNGDALPESKLSDALAGTSRELFFRVFAFGLDELASFEDLASQGSVSEALFAAGMQGAQRLPAVLDGLRRESEGIFAPRGTKKELNVLLNELQELQGQLRALGDRPAQYVEQSATLPKLDAELANLEQRFESAQRRLAQVERFFNVAMDLARYEVVRSELVALGDLADFPEGAVERLDQLCDSLAKARAERDEVYAEAASVERALAERAAIEGKGLDAPRLKVAVEAFQSRVQQFRALPAKKATLAERRRQVDAALAGLGLPVDQGRLLEMELGAAAKAKLSSLRDQLNDAKEIWRAREAAFVQARSSRDEIEQDIRRLTTEVAQLPSWPYEAVRRRQVSLARIETLRAEAQQLADSGAERRASANAQRALMAADVKPTPLFPAPSAGFVCVLLMALAAGAYALQGLWVGLLAGTAAVALIALVIWLQRRSAKNHAEAMEAFEARRAAHEQEAQRLTLEAELLQHKAKERRKELATCAAEVGLTADADDQAIAARTDELEQELNQVKLRQQLAVESESLTPKLVTARTLEKNAEVDKNVAEAKVSVLERLVDELYATLHFPARLPPERALELWSEVAALRQRLLDVRSEEEGLNEEDRDCLNAARAVLDAAHDVGVEASGPEEALSTLSGKLKAASEEAQERKALVARREELKLRRVKAERACVEHETSLSRLLQQGKAADPEVFRQRAKSAQEHRRASGEARELAVKIESACGRSVADVQAELKALGGRDGAARELEALRARAAALQADRQKLADERGGVKKQLALWESDGEIARLRGREEVLAGRVAELAQRYAVDRVAVALLDRARSKFEKEQQPKVVKLASELFRELTGGKYARIFNSTETQALVACDDSGKEWPAEQLSRGTREALYLAFRLAVIEDFGDTKSPLPLLVDDILVNFDPERTAATLALFARVAQRQQVIAFTCHPGVKDEFARLGAALHELVPSQGGLDEAQSA